MSEQAPNPEQQAAEQLAAINSVEALAQAGGQKPEDPNQLSDFAKQLAGNPEEFNRLSTMVDGDNAEPAINLTPFERGMAAESLVSKAQAQARANEAAEYQRGIKAHNKKVDIVNEAVERELYGLKIHNGGSMAFNKDPELRARLRAEARQIVADSGLDVSVLGTSVDTEDLKAESQARREKREANQAEYAGMLNDHDKKLRDAATAKYEGQTQSTVEPDVKKPGTAVEVYKPKEVVPVRSEDKQVETYKPPKSKEVEPEEIPVARVIETPQDVKDIENSGAELVKSDDPELLEATKGMALARERLAAASAHRRRRLFSFKNGRSNESYETAKKEYLKSCAIYARVYCTRMQEAGKNPTQQEKLAIVTSLAANERNILDKMQKEHFDGTKFGKFLNWYQKANRAQKFAAGVGMGVAGGAVAGVAALAGGAIGIGGLTAGVVASTRFARGFLQNSARHLKDGSAEDAKAFADRVSNVKTTDETFTAVTDVLDRRIKTDQKTMRKAVALGAGGVAVGAGLAALGHLGNDFLGRGNGNAASKIRGRVLVRDTGAGKFNAAMDGKAREMLGAKGEYPWTRAASVYGEGNASTRLIQAVNQLQSEGQNVHWQGNPLTDRNAWISFNGHSDTEYVWSHLSRTLVEQDFVNYVKAA